MAAGLCEEAVGSRQIGGCSFGGREPLREQIKVRVSRKVTPKIGYPHMPMCLLCSNCTLPM